MSTENSSSPDGTQATPSTVPFVQLTYRGLLQINNGLREGKLHPRDVFVLLNLASRKNFRRDDLKLSQAELAKTEGGRTVVNKSIRRLEASRLIAIEEGSPLRYILNPLYVRQGGKKVVEKHRKRWKWQTTVSRRRRQAQEKKRDAKRGNAPKPPTLTEVLPDAQKEEVPPPPTEEPTEGERERKDAEERKRREAEERKRRLWVRLGTMGTRQLVKAYREGKIPPTALRLLLLLIQRVCIDKDPLLWRRERLAADLGIDKTYVSHALAPLVEQRLVAKVRQGRTQDYVFNPALVTQGTMAGDVDALNDWIALQKAHLAEVGKTVARPRKTER